MSLLLEKKFDNPKTYVTLSILSFVSGLVSSMYGLAGYMFLPLTAALFSVLFLFDKSVKKVLSIGTVAFTIVADSLTTYFLGRIYTVVCLLAIIIALIMALAVAMKKTKASGAAASTCILCAGFMFYVYLAGAFAIGTADVTKVFEYYSYAVALIREQFVEFVLDNAHALTGAVEVTSENVALAFDLFVQSLISYLAVAAFLIVGVAHKIFSTLLSVFAEDKAAVAGRRFMPNVVFAYFYLISVVLTFFISGADVFVVTLSNLVTVFSFVYAYIGFRIIKAFLATRLQSGFAVCFFLILIAVIALLTSAAVELLAVIGAVSCVMASRVNLPRNDGFNDIQHD